MESELFLEKDERDNITCQIEDVAAQTTSLLLIAIFFSMKDYDVRSNWWLYDQPHVSSLLIFVGRTRIGYKLKPCAAMKRTMDTTRKRFQTGE